MTGEFVSVERDREIANDVFVWLQQVDVDESAPLLNENARDRLLSVFDADPARLAELKTAVSEQDPAHILPLRLYISGFDQEVVDKLDTDHVLNQAVFEFTEKHRGRFAVEASPVESIVVEPKDVTIGGLQTLTEHDL